MFLGNGGLLDKRSERGTGKFADRNAKLSIAELVRQKASNPRRAHPIYRRFASGDPALIRAWVR